VTDQERVALEREKERLSRFSIFERAVIAVLSVVCVAMLFVLVQLLIPYQPMRVYGLSAAPSGVCPGKKIGVRLDWELRRPLRRLEVDYAWSEAGQVGREFGGTAIFRSLEARSRETIRSPAARQTPAEPGEWRLVTEYEAYGPRWGLPLRQDLTVASENTVRVLPQGGPRCEGDR
jgi:hypothetical protein